ncbi:MAG: histidine kinase [Blastocatellia bacterium]|nr:histidine kinase [Blastocatellia bacterium]
MDSENKWKRPAVKWLMIAGVWTLIALFFTGETLMRSQLDGPSLPWLRVLGWQLFSCYLWLAFLPLILWLGRRFRFERGQLTRSLMIHFAAALVIPLLQQGIDAFVLPRLGYPPGRHLDSFLATYKSFLLFNYPINVAAYWATIGAQYGIGYYHMYRERELRASQLEAKLAQSQLQVLKMQLHPHFLFNTLNTISELIHKDPDVAEQMVTNLSDLLRLALQTAGGQEVPLQQELDFLEKYLEIEQMRFHDRLLVRMEIDPDALNASVPNMILQPLVENAIRHGIAPLDCGGRIEIRAARDNGRLSLRVSDDGQGLPGGNIAAIKEGVGLANTRARLKHLYGAEHRFELRGAPGPGLTLEMTIPYRRFVSGEQDED